MTPAQPVVELRRAAADLGGRRVLHPLSLQVMADTVLGVAGRSGAGKSTLARLLTLHLRPASGSVRLQSGDPWGQSEEELRDSRRKTQLVFQNPQRSLPKHWKVLEAVMEPVRITGWRPSPAQAFARELIRSVRLEPEIEGRRTDQLSGGQAARVAIARALAALPECLVLDESLCSLDLPVRNEILNMLDDIRRERQFALVVVSHDLRLLRRIATDLLVIDDGRVADCGPAESVLSRPWSTTTSALIHASFGGREW